MNIIVKLKRIAKLLDVCMPKIIISDSMPNSYADGIIFLEKGMAEARTLYAALHELRHHFQSEYIKKNNDEIAKIWNEEMNSYNLSEKIYLDYFIERDAYAFAYVVMNEYYKMNYKLPEFLLDVINKHLDKYKYLYLNFYNYKV